MDSNKQNTTRIPSPAVTIMVLTHLYFLWKHAEGQIFGI
jgi:hypothetical protein